MDWLTGPLAYQFFQRALAAGVLVGALCGALSVFVVQRRMSSIGHGLAHSVLGGVGVALALEVHLSVGAVVATLLAAALIDRVGRRRGLHHDAAIWIVTTGLFALGVVLVTRAEGVGVSTESLLFGHVLGVTAADLWLAGGVAVGFAALLWVGGKQLVAVTFDSAVAAAHGVRTARMDALLTVAIAAVVVASVRVLGVLLIAAAVVLPAALARLVTASFPRLLAIATAVGTASAVVGLFASFHLDAPSGAAIVLTATLAFAVTFVATAARSAVRRARGRRVAAPTAALLLALALLAAACAGGEKPADPGADRAATPAGETPEADDDAAAEGARELQIVATLPPLADLAAQVAGERAAVSSLVPPGADSHTYEPRPSDVAELEAADAYVGGGLGLDDGALELAEATLPEDAPVVRLGEAALSADDLLGGAGGEPGPGEPEARDHDGAHADDGEAGHAHADGGHAAGPNPHTWMSPPLAGAKVEAIAEMLAELDPAGAERYRENARAYREELAELHASIEEAVATVPADRRTLVTFHDAHAYFADAYGLEMVGAVQPSDFSEPSASDVAALIEQIEAHDVPAVFGSRAFPADVGEQIATETGATYHRGLSDDVLPGEPGSPEHSYLGLMARNARVIVGGLGGDPGRVAGPGRP